jgi:hypothetical protein
MKEVFGALENVCMYVFMYVCENVLTTNPTFRDSLAKMNVYAFCILRFDIYYTRDKCASDFQKWLIYRHYQRLISLVGGKV